MPHGITLQMRWIKRPAPRYVHEHPPARKIRIGGEVVGYAKPAGMTPYRGPSRDRSLRGKARIRARKAARR